MPNGRSSRALTTALPVTFTEAMEQWIADAVRKWYAQHEAQLSSEASHQLFVADFLHRLQTGSGTLEAAHIVEFARNGHPPADHALRRFVLLAAEARRLDSLPSSVLGYMQVIATHAPLPVGYPSTASQIINNFIRDIVLCRAVARVMVLWPGVPLKSSARRRCGGGLGRGRVWPQRGSSSPHLPGSGDLAQRFQKFMATYPNQVQTGVPPNVPRQGQIRA